MTPMLTRIDQELAQSADPDRRAELLAERASYLARLGEFAEANKILAMLRKTYGDGRNARVSVWIMFVEGLVLFFESINPAARDRILRANLISSSAQLLDLSTLTAAWLAFVDFNRADFPSMLQKIHQWDKCSSDFGAAASLRFHLTIADSFMYCGETQQAKNWYERTRLLAVKVGDEATLAAMIYNKAAQGLGRLRVNFANGVIDTELVKFVSLEIASAHNFHKAAGHFALLQLIDACKARILLLQGKFEEAATQFSQLLAGEELQFGFRSDRVLLQIEYGLCLAHVGGESEAVSILNNFSMSEYRQMTCDDRLVFLVTYASLVDRAGVESRIPAIVGETLRCKMDLADEIASLRDGLVSALMV